MSVHRKLVHLVTRWRRRSVPDEPETLDGSGRRVTPERREILLVEYQAAQASAEHHDDQVWSVTSLNWVGSAVLMGFVVNGIGTHQPTSHRIALSFIAGAGILLSVFVWIWARQGRLIKNQKYARCKQIERELGMTQHRGVKHPAGYQRFQYSCLMVAFLTAWFVLIVVVWWPEDNPYVWFVVLIAAILGIHCLPDPPEPA